MLTDKDIDRMMKVFATKDDVQAIMRRLDSVEDTVQRVLTVVDRLAAAVEELGAEYAAVKVQLSRHERWIKELARKAGVSLADD